MTPTFDTEQRFRVFISRKDADDEDKDGKNIRFLKDSVKFSFAVETRRYNDNVNKSPRKTQTQTEPAHVCKCTTCSWLCAKAFVYVNTDVLHENCHIISTDRSDTGTQIPIMPRCKASFTATVTRKRH